MPSPITTTIARSTRFIWRRHCRRWRPGTQLGAASAAIELLVDRETRGRIVPGFARSLTGRFHAVPGSPIRAGGSFDHILEVMFESGRRDDLEDSTHGIAGIPKGVPLIARLEHQVAGICVDDLVAQRRTEPALEDKTVLVLSCVAMQGSREMPWRDRMLDQGETTTRFVTPHHESNATRSEIDHLSVVWTNNSWRHQANHSSSGTRAPSAEKSPASRIASAASAIARTATHVKLPPTLTRRAPAATSSANDRPGM